MFNTLVYIPTILAYIFITLLLVILGFIVIYVAHKIYTTLYDNLPVAQLSLKSSLAPLVAAMGASSNLLTPGSKSDGRVDRTSKTALRIIVSLEPCYLAYMVFESKLIGGTGALARLYQISNRSVNNSLALRDSLVLDDDNDNFVIKYFDSLASLPCSRDLQNCNSLKFDHVCTGPKCK